MGQQELPWLETAETGSSCSQHGLQVHATFPYVIRALEACSQVCANPGTEPEEKGRCSPTSPSASLTDLATNPGLMAPGLPLQWCQPPWFRVPKWTQPRHTSEGEARARPIRDPETAWPSQGRQLKVSPAAPRGTPVPGGPSHFRSSPTTPAAVPQEAGPGPGLLGHSRDVPLGQGSSSHGAGGELPWLCTEQH